VVSRTTADGNVAATLRVTDNPSFAEGSRELLLRFLKETRAQVLDEDFKKALRSQ
jgi:hypothetical protein